MPVSRATTLEENVQCESESSITSTSSLTSGTNKLSVVCPVLCPEEPSTSKSAALANENLQSPDPSTSSLTSGTNKLSVVCPVLCPEEPGTSKSTALTNENIQSSEGSRYSSDLDDSISEAKTSGSEYIPSDEMCSSDEETFTNISEHLAQKPMKPKGSLKATHSKTTAHKKYRASRDDKVTSSQSNQGNLANKQAVRIESDGTLPDSTTIIKNKYTVGERVDIFAAITVDGKRVRNKFHICYFCQKSMLNAARHFELLHDKERDVAKLLALPKASKLRRDGFANLLRIGDFYHNVEVLNTGSGQLILTRQPTADEVKFVTYKDYGPCPHCMGFMLKKHLWKHIQRGCTAVNNEKIESSKHVIAESNAILYNTFGNDLSTEFMNEIVSKMRTDEIGEYCNEDQLILTFGAMQFEKYGKTQSELIRQSMRQLARLALTLREPTGKLHLSDFLKPQTFDQIVLATKKLSGVQSLSKDKRPEFGVPSLALKVGYSLKKCAALQRGKCLRAGNVVGDKILIDFLQLMEMEWAQRISSSALATMYNRKMNSTQLLPLTSDLVKLSNYINHQMEKTRNCLEDNLSSQHWYDLATLTLSKIILFNKRRSGEAARMTLANYHNRPDWSKQCTEELKESLSAFEKELAKRLIVLEITGKRGRKVPVLLSSDVKLSIEVLLKTRSKMNISPENIYLFARRGSSTESMRGHACLRKICIEADLEHPEYITSTKLRKYMATVCQVFSLNENDYDWLARHLGHDIRVHREFYRLHESAVELTKVSRLLIAVEQGEANKFAGKKLEEINLQDIPNIESDDEEVRDDVANNSIRNEVIEPQSTKLTRSQVSSDPLEPDACQIQVPAPSRKVHLKSIKRPWNSEEKKAVLNFFVRAIKKGTVPGKADCTTCIEENECLSKRSWTDVKFAVKNHLDKLKRASRKK